MEDLNLERNTLKIIKYCWFNKRRFRSINEILITTKCTKYTLKKLVAKYDLPDRGTITIYDAPNKKSTQARTEV